jgi:ribosomal protein S27E
MSSEAQPTPQRTDPRTGLPLPDPYPEYMPCPHCGELEVEVWCYQARVRCHHCGQWITHTPAPCRGTAAICRAAMEFESKDSAT